MTGITRRLFATGAGVALLGGFGRMEVRAAGPEEFAAAMARLEAQSGGRLGVAVIDTATGRRASHRGEERFPMCSTFKLLASGAVLTRVDAGHEDLGRQIRYEAGDLVTYSPVTEKHVGEGMTLAGLCEAALTQSDNTAGNLILASLGGPAALTAFARTLGDSVSRLDRNEPDLNEALPGDPRDTTTPNALAADLQSLVLGDKLSPRSREQLTTWLLANQTGGARLRAGVPAEWRVGDKTGTGDRGTANDVGVLWPPGRAPLIVCVYLTDNEASPEARSATIASVARVVAGSFTG
jgi:beta-lactamase class A